MNFNAGRKTACAKTTLNITERIDSLIGVVHFLIVLSGDTLRRRFYKNSVCCFCEQYFCRVLRFKSIYLKQKLSNNTRGRKIGEYFVKALLLIVVADTVVGLFVFYCRLIAVDGRSS